MDAPPRSRRRRRTCSASNGDGAREAGELEEEAVDDNYITFLASIFRSVRFGAASARGRAHLIQLRYLEEKGAFT